MPALIDFLCVQAEHFLSFFWSVFSLWAVWQFCDYCLHKLGIKFVKPWTLERQSSPQPK